MKLSLRPLALVSWLNSVSDDDEIDHAGRLSGARRQRQNIDIKRRSCSMLLFHTSKTFYCYS